MTGDHGSKRFWRKSFFWRTYLLSVALVSAVVFLGEAAEDAAEFIIDRLGLPLNDLQTEIIAWLVVIVPATLGGSYILSRLVTRALTGLKEAAESLASGRLEARADGAMLKREDEIGDLSRSFNHMADSLTGLLANERRLIRDISHEIRSPLARLRMAVTLCERKVTSPAPLESVPYLEQMDKDIQFLDDLVGELLEQSRLDGLNSSSGEAALYGRQEVDLRGLVDEAVRSFSPWAVSEQLSIDKQLPAEAVIINGTSQLLRRIIDNLIKNALHYTKPRTAVSVRLAAGPEGAILEIADQGPGLSAEHLAGIFRPFYRVDDSRSRASGGFGLGLAIVRQAAELHGGTVTAENRSEGGLRVRVTLPVAKTV